MALDTGRQGAGTMAGGLRRTLFHTLAEDNFAAILGFADYAGRDAVSSRAYQSLFLSAGSPFRRTATRAFAVLQLRWQQHFACDFEFAGGAGARRIVFDTCIMYKTAARVLRAYGPFITELRVSGFDFSNLDHWEPADVRAFPALIADLCPLLSTVTVQHQSEDFARLLMDALQGRLKAINIGSNSRIPLSYISTRSNLRHLRLAGPYNQVSSLDELWIAIGSSLETLNIGFKPPSWAAFCTSVSEHCRNLRTILLNPGVVANAPESQYAALLRSYGDQLVSASPLNLNALSLLQIARECPNLRCKLSVEPSQFSRVMALAACVEHLEIDVGMDVLDVVLFTRAVEKCTQMVAFKLDCGQSRLKGFVNGPAVLPPSTSLHLERVVLRRLAPADCDTLFANCTALKEVSVFTKLERLHPDFFRNLVKTNPELHTISVEAATSGQVDTVPIEYVLARIVNQLKESNSLRRFEVHCTWAKWRAEFRNLLMPLHRLNTKCVLHLCNHRYEVHNGRLDSFPTSIGLWEGNGLQYL